MNENQINIKTALQDVAKRKDLEKQLTFVERLIEAQSYHGFRNRTSFEKTYEKIYRDIIKERNK